MPTAGDLVMMEQYKVPIFYQCHSFFISALIKVKKMETPCSSNTDKLVCPALVRGEKRKFIKLDDLNAVRKNVLVSFEEAEEEIVASGVKKGMCILYSISLSIL